MSDVMALVDWLREQIAEDERVALFAGGEEWLSVRPGSGATLVELDVVIDENNDVAFEVERDKAVHIASWDPARVLAEVAAKRAMLDEHPDIEHGCGTCVVGEWGYPEKGGCHPEPWPCATIRLLAQPYASRPGFRPEWTVAPPG